MYFNNLQFKYILENKVDKNIIGGFILRVGDVQYNASVAHKLNRLKQEFQEKLFL